MQSSGDLKDILHRLHCLGVLQHAFVAQPVVHCYSVRQFLCELAHVHVLVAIPVQPMQAVPNLVALAPSPLGRSVRIVLVDHDVVWGPGCGGCWWGMRMVSGRAAAAWDSGWWLTGGG